MLFGAVTYLGTQVGGLHNRVDTLVTAVAGTQGELRAINQRLTILEDIRDRLENLASADPAPAPAGGPMPPSDAEPAVAIGDRPQPGVILLGHVAANELESTLRMLVDAKTVDIIIAEESDGVHSILTYSSIHTSSHPRAQGVQIANDLDQFVSFVQQYGIQYPGSGILTVSTNDPQLHNVLDTFEGEHGRKSPP